MPPCSIGGGARLLQRHGNRVGGMAKRTRVRAGVLLAALLTQGACSTLGSLKDTFFGGAPRPGEPKRLEGFIGGVAADEARAALAGREVLATGGTAADAAVAMGFTLAVTLPSRAGLGGGGACVVYKPGADSVGRGVPEAVVFVPPPSTGTGGGADRPAAVPMLARGLFALHARYGAKPFESLISPAEQLARFGAPPSRALLRDLAIVTGPLLADPNARAIFGVNGAPLNEASTLVQADLAGTLSAIRTAGVGDFYQGAFARRLVDGATVAGGGITLDDLRAALPRTGGPLVIRSGNDSVAFLPPPADGGLAAAAALQSLDERRDMGAAQSRAAGVLARWRQVGGDPQAVLVSGGSGVMPALPASTSFVALDRNGGAVACALTMNNLFGTGRVAPGTGIVLAVSPRVATPPALAAGIVWNTNTNNFRAAAAGSGQDGAALATAVGLYNALHSTQAMPSPVPEPGRANVVSCTRYLPGREGECSWATDPRGAGLAAGGN